jgi:hypothetical protein
MSLPEVQFGGQSFSKLIIGGNPFSGFSHQSVGKDDEMRHYYTSARIRQTLREAERMGITTHISRADHHVMRYLMEYWDEGGTIRWIGQTCPEIGSMERGATNAIGGGAKACYIHGGVMDNLLANGRLDEIVPVVAKIKAAGLPVGVAGHNPAVLEWAEEHLDVDFYMCSYYNPTSRANQAEHVHGASEWFKEEDRRIMAGLIQKLRRPAIHYKVMAAGRNKPEEALKFVADHLRPQDAVCIGIFSQDAPGGMKQNLQLLERFVR